MLKKRGIGVHHASKHFFKELGYKHTSIDTNGQNGAIKLDLSKEIRQEDMINAFDVLTNCGTSEHVKKGQYECFLNCHNLCKENAVMVHIVPMVNNWKNHGDYYYSHKFFKELAKECNYEMIGVDTMGADKYHLVAVALKKTEESKFVDKGTFQEIFKHNK